MNYNKKIYFVKDLLDNYLKFEINNNNLIIKNLNEPIEKREFIIKKDVIDYSLYIETINKIHIFYINSIGDLNYFNYPNYLENIKILNVKNDFPLNNLNINIFNCNVFTTIDCFSKNTLILKWNNHNTPYSNNLKDILSFNTNNFSPKTFKNNNITKLQTLKENNIISPEDEYTKSLLTEISKKDNKIKELMTTMLNSESHIKTLKNEYNNLQLNLNIKISSLLKLLEEKNNIILSLSNIINKK